jgi:asparagine synthase (glutamine-hydrolysing)
MVRGRTAPSHERLAGMAARLAHRGCDGNGQSIDDWAGLGCRRLAIIDVAGGRQPLANERADVLAVCNGEIYNHAALRAELASRGHGFRTRSDAEVVPHLYDEHGLDFVEWLDGMFAVALWDAPRKRLVLARDRLGEKPLYYASTPAGFFFASEPKALLGTGHIDRTPNWPALARYLHLGYIPTDATAYEHVRVVPPGGRLVFEDGQVRVDRYWTVAPFISAPPIETGMATAATTVRTLLDRAVQSTLTSDVPVGVFLSGGLDSTAVAALARRVIGPSLGTFSIGFDTPAFDESGPAAAAARALDTRHHAVTITPSLFLEGLRGLVPLLDEPIADPALVPLYLLAREARAHVKVALVGEGSDELFGGYPTYLGALLARRYERLPRCVRRLGSAAGGRLGASAGNTTLRYLARRFLETTALPPVARHHAWVGCFRPEALAALATPGGPLRKPVEMPPALDARSELDTLLALDLTSYLPGDLLVKLDRATMAVSLEGRAPFLDHHLVEFACRLPAALKLRGVTGKVVLRQAVADLVPPSVLRRTKRGLTTPLASWIAGPLLPFVRATLARLPSGIVRREAVRELLEVHLARKRDNRREIWALVMLQLWLEQYESPESIA